jgi:hypothetical protein
MKSQRFVFLKVVRNENKELILVDSNGVEFLVPQINEAGTSLYKRAVAAANNPSKYCFKARVSGNLTTGSIEFGRVPAEKFEGAEPVTNFNQPNGGLEVFQMKSTPQITDVVARPLEENFMNFVHSGS